MKIRDLVVLFVLACIGSCSSADRVITKGMPIPAASKVIRLTEVIANPHELSGRTIVTEGVVKKVCRLKGCWMVIAPIEGGEGIRVTFAKGGFTVPRNSGGRRALVMGTLRLRREGTAFVASGVELTGESK
ncbi:MAG: DUF4920 domain-containing protein [Acidobacteria bacterium]|nr:DUF4920 domain-containing protein [Acidobacteriota bacterium]